MDTKKVVRSKVFKRKIRRFILALFVISPIVFAFYYFFLSSKTNKEVKELEKENLSQIDDEVIQKKIQKNLKEVRFKHKLAQDEILLKAEKFKPDASLSMDDSNQWKLSSLEVGVDLSQEDIFDEIITLIDEVHPKSGYYEDIEDRIARYKIIGKEIKKLVRHPVEQKANYIQKFLENAKAKGYDVRLNKELEVISVKKIKK